MHDSVVVQERGGYVTAKITEIPLADEQERRLVRRKGAQAKIIDINERLAERNRQKRKLSPLDRLALRQAKTVEEAEAILANTNGVAL